MLISERYYGVWVVLEIKEKQDLIDFIDIDHAENQDNKISYFMLCFETWLNSYFMVHVKWYGWRKVLKNLISRDKGLQSL